MYSLNKTSINYVTEIMGDHLEVKARVLDSYENV